MPIQRKNAAVKKTAPAKKAPPKKTAKAVPPPEAPPARGRGIYDRSTNAFPLERGHQKWLVMKDIADGLQMRVIAAKYGANLQSVYGFKDRHEHEINELRAMVQDEFRGLWIASKYNRIAEYQQAVEDIEQALNGILSAGGTLDREDMVYIKEKRQILRQVAEELGQLPNRNNVQVAGTTVTYAFNGIDPDQLS